MCATENHACYLKSIIYDGMVPKRSGWRFIFLHLRNGSSCAAESLTDLVKANIREMAAQLDQVEELARKDQLMGASASNSSGDGVALGDGVAPPGR